mgnify:CR=1 FL=1
MSLNRKKILSGVDNIFNIPEQKTIPKIVRIAASTVIEIIEVKTEVLSFSKFFRTEQLRNNNSRNRRLHLWLLP